jgi:hypothetical protein
MSIRKNAEVHVSNAIDGSKKVKMRQQGTRRAVATVDHRKIHEDVLKAALKIAEGDVHRLDWGNATVVDGVITEIRVLNRPKR